VFIEAKIVETTLNDDYSMGINWEHMFQSLDPRFSLRTVSQPGLPTAPALSLNYNTIVSGGDLGAVLEALKAIGETRILSNPHIAVMDGQEATIEVVEDQPYKEVTLESGTTNVTGVTYLFKKVGVQLAVTPRINEEKFVTVSIKPEISSISQWYDGAPQEGTPVIRKALAETTVMVKDGVTIIIGGLIKDRRDTSSSRVPVLGSIPLVGRLFRYDVQSTVNTETIVFLTPRIVTGDEPYLLMKDMKKTPKPMRPVGGSGGKDFKPLR
jgi:type II secretory pathway component GspD/PulD (secretin)